MLTKNDLSQIKTVVQQTINPEIKALGTEINTLKKNIKTLEQSMSTKGDMKSLESRLNSDMKSLEGRLTGNMKTLESGLKGEMQTLKGEMQTLETRLTERIEEAQMEIIATVDKHKADKESIKVLEKRVERLEDNADLPPYLD